MVVRDIDRVMQFYSSVFGIGPWLVRGGDAESTTPDGKVHSYKMRVAFAWLGSAQLELFQVTGGRSPVHSDWLDKGYEGIHHLGFFVSSEERQRMPTELAKMGIEVYQGRQLNVFMNTAGMGGIFFEFIDGQGGVPEPPLGSSPPGRIKLPSNLQLGVVVKDVGKVTDFYSTAFGIGPWQERTGGGPEATVGGKVYDFRTHLAFASLPGVQLEVFTITKGTSPVHAVFLDQAREGGHHFGFFVSEEERQQIKQEMAGMGVEVFQEGEVARAGKYVFFDTRKEGGPFFEFIALITG
jgi:catechol 2,3-dioxygenase-like lactoylglutathione lyase family enzyme